METALFSEEGEQALVDIDETDVVASLVVDKQLFQLAFGDADAGVVDVDLEIVLVLDEAGLDAAALRTLEDAVDDGVLDERLEEKRWDLDLFQLVLGEIIGDGEAVAETGALELGVALDDVQLFGERDEFRRVVQAVAEIVGEVADELSRIVRIASDVVADGIQRVIEEVWIDLCLKSADLGFGEKIFLFLHLVVLIDGFEQVTDAGEEFIAHVREVFPFAFSGDEGADGLTLVADGKGGEMRHGRKGFLQLQDGDLRIALIAVCFGFVCRACINLIFIDDGGPDEGGERRRHDLCGF